MSGSGFLRMIGAGGILALAGCRAGAPVSALLAVDCIGGHECHVGFDYGPDSTPALGSLRNFGRRDGAGVTGVRGPGGDGGGDCLVYGPYLEFERNDWSHFAATFDFEAWECNAIGGGCGGDFWAGYQGVRYEHSSKTQGSTPASFVIDMVAEGGMVLAEKEIQVNRHLGRSRIMIQSDGYVRRNVNNLEVRVCRLSTGSHREFIRMHKHCHAGECQENPVIETREDQLKVAVHGILIEGSFQTAP